MEIDSKNAKFEYRSENYTIIDTKKRRNRFNLALNFNKKSLCFQIIQFVQPAVFLNAEKNNQKTVILLIKENIGMDLFFIFRQKSNLDF